MHHYGFEAKIYDVMDIGEIKKQYWRKVYIKQRFLMVNLAVDMRKLSSVIPPTGLK